MGVQVDQARRDDGAGAVTHRRRVFGETVADRRDFAAGEGDIGDPVEILGRIDHPCGRENEIESHIALPAGEKKLNYITAL